MIMLKMCKTWGFLVSDVVCIADVMFVFLRLMRSQVGAAGPFYTPAEDF